MIKGETVLEFESSGQSTGLSNANLSDEYQKVFLRSSWTESNK